MNIFKDTAGVTCSIYSCDNKNHSPDYLNAMRSIPKHFKQLSYNIRPNGNVNAYTAVSSITKDNCIFIGHIFLEHLKLHLFLIFIISALIASGIFTVIIAFLPENGGPILLRQLADLEYENRSLRTEYNELMAQLGRLDDTTDIAQINKDTFTETVPESTDIEEPDIILSAEVSKEIIKRLTNLEIIYNILEEKIKKLE